VRPPYGRASPSLIKLSTRYGLPLGFFQGGAIVGPPVVTLERPIYGLQIAPHSIGDLVGIRSPSLQGTTGQGLGFTGQVTAVGPTPTVTPQGTTGATSYSYAIGVVDAAGDVQAAGPDGSTATGNATLTGANFNRVTWTAVTGAAFYIIYRTVSGGTPSSLGIVGVVPGGTLTFDDTGIAASGALQDGTVKGRYDLQSLSPWGLAAGPYATLGLFGGVATVDPNQMGTTLDPHTPFSGYLEPPVQLMPLRFGNNQFFQNKSFVVGPGPQGGDFTTDVLVYDDPTDRLIVQPFQRAPMMAGGEFDFATDQVRVPYFGRARFVLGVSSRGAGAVSVSVRHVLVDYLGIEYKGASATLATAAGDSIVVDGDFLFGTGTTLPKGFGGHWIEIAPVALGAGINWYLEAYDND
jgi:hypothetical protein